MTNAHFICQHQEHWRRLGDGLYETGDWVMADEVAQEIKDTGGRVYLHEKQRANAWHGGPVLDWRCSPGDPRRKVFTYRVDGPFRIRCLGQWAQEKCVFRG